MGALNVVTLVISANRYQVLLANMIPVLFEHGWAVTAASFQCMLIAHFVKMLTLSLDLLSKLLFSHADVYMDQINALWDSYFNIYDASDFKGEAKTISFLELFLLIIFFDSTYIVAYVFKFHIATAQGKKLEAVQALESAILHFHKHYASSHEVVNAEDVIPEVFNESDDNNNAIFGDVELVTQYSDKQRLLADEEEEPEYKESIKPAEIEKEKEEQAARDVDEKRKNLPSAILLSNMRTVVAYLIATAPRAPRTQKLVMDLLSCANQWAALSYPPAILFSVYLTYTRSTLARERGEMSSSNAWCKHTLQMIEDHQNLKKENATPEGIDDSTGDENDAEGESFEELDSAIGMLRYQMDSMMWIGLNMNYPLYKYAEAQKWFEQLLAVVNTNLGTYFPSFFIIIIICGINLRIVGDTPLPGINTKLGKKDSMLWDKKAVAYRGIASALSSQVFVFFHFIENTYHVCRKCLMSSYCTLRIWLKKRCN